MGLTTGTETKFVTVSSWATIESITDGTGADPRRARHLDRNKELLLDRPVRRVKTALSL